MEIALSWLSSVDLWTQAERMISGSIALKLESGRKLKH